MNSKSVSSLAVLLVLSAVPAAALAQDHPAGEAVPTSTADGGYVDTDAKIAPAGQGRTVTVPAPKQALYKGPLDRLSDIPRSNFLSNLHGSVGVMVGSHNTRGAYANVYGPIGDHAAFALNFASVRSDGMPLYDGGYGYGGYPAYGYGGREFYPSGASFGGYGRTGRGYGYGPGSSTSVGASIQLGGQDRYDRVWPNYAPPGREETTDVTDEPLSSSQ